MPLVIGVQWDLFDEEKNYAQLQEVLEKVGEGLQPEAEPEPVASHGSVAPPQSSSPDLHKKIAYYRDLAATAREDQNLPEALNRLQQAQGLCDELMDAAVTKQVAQNAGQSR